MGISREEALDCFRSDDLIGIGMEADAVRRKLHPENVVTYAVEGRIDQGESEETIGGKVDELVESGATGAILHGEIRPEHTLTRFETLLQTIKKRFPSLWLSLSSEVAQIARLSGSTVHDTIARLRDAGLDSISDNHVNGHSDWMAVHRAAHVLGLETTASMVMGGGETIEQRVNHLEAIQQLQQETGGFAAFQPIVSRGLAEPTAVEYLKTLAISRMFLDNVENVQSNVEIQDLKVLQVSLRFGGNDGGSVPLGEENLRHAIRDAGFRPVRREMLYRMMLLN